MWAGWCMQGALTPVLVEQPAESVAPAHCTWLALAGDVQASRGIRRPQLQRSVRDQGVVVAAYSRRTRSRWRRPDQQPVQALRRTVPPTLGERVRSGAAPACGPPRRPRAEHRRRRGGGTWRPGRGGGSDPPARLAQRQHQVARLLGDPGAVRVGRHPGEVHAAGVQLDEEQDVEPPQPHRLHGEEVARQHPGGLRPQERRPGGARPPRGRARPWRRGWRGLRWPRPGCPACSSPWMRW